MSFGSMFRELCCSAFAKKTAEDLAEQYGGETGKNLVGGNNELVNGLLGALSGKQQLSVQNVASMVQSSGGEHLVQHAEKKGLDPALLNGIMGMLKGGGGGGGEDGGDGGGGGGGGVDMGSVIKMIGGLTGGGGSGDGGADGFMQLLQGFAGGSGGEGASTGNIVQILLGLAKSYFNVKGKSNPAIQDWDAAGAGQNKNDDNFLNWALSIIRDLIFPGKKPKEIIESGGDDDIDTGTDSGKKKDDGDVKGWFDGHPEIGKMQKDVFDDIFDTTDDDKTDEDDDVPVIPTPSDFQENCSCLDNASILFLNCNLLLEYRKNWRFLFSTLSHSRSLDEMMSKICYKGPTIIIIKDTDGNMFGAHASTSWCDTEGGWVGNGECFLFSIQPKMAIFHSTGKDENLQMLSDELLALGGQPGNFGLELNNDLTSGSSSGNIETFHTIQLTNGPTFEIDHVEVWGLGPEPDERTERANTKPRQPNLKTRGGDVADMLDLESQIM